MYLIIYIINNLQEYFINKNNKFKPYYEYNIEYQDNIIFNSSVKNIFLNRPSKSSQNFKQRRRYN